MIVAAREILSAAFRHGAIHAGNFAYLSLVSLFPAAILLVAIAGAFGNSEAGEEAVKIALAYLPPEIGAVLRPVVDGVLLGQSAGALKLSALVALWTVSGFIETLRSIILQALDAAPTQPYWLTRLVSGLLVLAVCLALLLGLLLNLLFQLVRSLLGAWIESAGLALVEGPTAAALSIVPLFLGLWLLFALLTPGGARRHVWAGALLVTFAWVAGSLLIGPMLALFGGMARTYGALSGVMVALLFFYALGFALVVAAELNAALFRRSVRRLEEAA